MLQKPHPALCLARWAIFLLLGACPVFGAGWKQLHGHVPEITKKLSATGRLAATNELHLAIGVPLRDPAGLDQFLADVYDPASPNYRHFLTPAEFTARFSATVADYAAVKNFALTNGFKISGEHGNRLLLDVTARAADVERAFQIKLNKFQHPTEAREFFGPDAEPTVDTAMAVADVSGLSDYWRPHPKSHKMDPKTVAPKNGSAPDNSGAYFGDDFRNAYAPGVTLTGTGQSVGLLQFDAFYASDIQTYAQTAGGGRTNIQVVAIPVGVSSVSPGGGNVEVSIDIELAMAMAPGLSKIYVFETTSTIYLNSMLNAMAASNTVKNLSCSWGWGGGPSATTDAIFQTMAAQGQSFFNASGDSCAFLTGAVDNPSYTNTPSSSPYITQVGGTTLTTGSGVSYGSETVWNQSNGSGSSGGISSYYALPIWQSGISMASNGGSTSFRNIPDVALTAYNCYIDYGNGTHDIYGGTSCAAPLWAGFMALVNQQLVAVTGSSTNSVGFINPAIYAIGEGLNPNYSYDACFHDTTNGNNYWSSSPTNFPAVAGYDLCTGWGTPNGLALINALAGLADPLGVTPATGLSISGLAGGPFSPSSQIFTLTNSGASSFNWSLINTSAWLNVSSGGGTLAAAGQTAVTISLNSTANSLAVGNYSATVGFSNQTSHVLQNRQFTLQITDPLVLLTTSGFTAYGAPGGPFNPGSQAVVFTNLSASPVPWSLINMAAWLSASSTNGSLAGYGSASVTVSTNANTAGLGNGIYGATLVLSNQSSHLTQSLAFTANVNQNLVQNGGFETGNYTSWTLSDSGGPDLVDNGATSVITPYDGSYEFAFGQANSYAYLSQNLPTTPGQTYLLSFWVSNPTTGGFGKTEKFKANWNTNSTSTNNIYNLSNPSSFGWTQKTFVVTATGTNTTLQFAVRNDPGYFGLDDVSVTPISLPTITQQPSSQTNLVGSNVVFTAAASGTTPLAYQWRTNGVKLVNGTVVSGATSNVLTLTGIGTANAGSYTLVVTNAYGSVTSSVANLTVALPPGFAGNLTNRTIECGANTNGFSITPAGTPPLGIQWSTNGVPVIGATGINFALTNLHLAAITNVAVTVTNLYGSVSSNATLTVMDTRPPVITILGANPLTNELGTPFTDPGATANDLCAGALSVVTNNVVNVGAVGTYLLKYVATDGVNSATNTRIVIVRDTTPPTISWSFTNLVFAAGTNATVPLPDVTGTNFILATDLSGTVIVTQNPAFKSALPLGTNAVLLTVADPSGNAAYSTNTIVVVVSTNSTPNISSLAFSAGALNLQLSGSYGSTYVLEGATNIISGTWQPVATNTLGVSGAWLFSDFGVTNNPSRFYRLRLVQ